MGHCVEDRYQKSLEEREMVKKEKNSLPNRITK
jgi:hypothetical protein